MSHALDPLESTDPKKAATGPIAGIRRFVCVSTALLLMGIGLTAIVLGTYPLVLALLGNQFNDPYALPMAFVFVCVGLGLGRAGVWLKRWEQARLFRILSSTETYQPPSS